MEESQSVDKKHNLQPEMRTPRLFFRARRQGYRYYDILSVKRCLFPKDSDNTRDEGENLSNGDGGGGSGGGGNGGGGGGLWRPYM